MPFPRVIPHSDGAGVVESAGGVPDAVRESDATLTAAPDLAWFI
jgi:hypothetical protein